MSRARDASTSTAAMPMTGMQHLLREALGLVLLRRRRRADCFHCLVAVCRSRASRGVVVSLERAAPAPRNDAGRLLRRFSISPRFDDAPRVIDSSCARRARRPVLPTSAMGSSSATSDLALRAELRGDAAEASRPSSHRALRNLLIVDKRFPSRLPRPRSASSTCSNQPAVRARPSMRSLGRFLTSCAHAARTNPWVRSPSLSEEPAALSRGGAAAAFVAQEPVGWIVYDVDFSLALQRVLPSASRTTCSASAASAWRRRSCSWKECSTTVGATSWAGRLLLRAGRRSVASSIVRAFMGTRRQLDLHQVEPDPPRRLCPTRPPR